MFKMMSGKYIASGLILLLISMGLTLRCQDEPNPFYVGYLSPTDGATDVALDTEIIVSLSHIVDPTTMTTNIDTYECTGTIQVSADGFTTCVPMTQQPQVFDDYHYSLQPKVSLQAGITYQIKVTTGVVSVKGIRLSEDYITPTGFTTIGGSGGSPTVIATDPSDGETDVFPDLKIKLTFNREMNISTMTVNTMDTACTGNVQLSSDNFSSCVTFSAPPQAQNLNKEFILTPTNRLQDNTTYKIKVLAAVTTSLHEPLSEPYIHTLGFTTGTWVDPVIAYYQDVNTSLSDEAFILELQALIDDHVVMDYTTVRQHMYQTIFAEGSPGTIECVYTGQILSTDYNCEHTWPQSSYDEWETAKTDLHHLFPAWSDANLQRFTNPFGVVTGGITWENGGSKKGTGDYPGTVFEPRDEHKGVVARAHFYISTRYHGNVNFDTQNWGYDTYHITNQMETTLKTWHTTFPVSDEERTRNDTIFELQGNRNPFVDHPEWVSKITDF